MNRATARKSIEAYLNSEVPPPRYRYFENQPANIRDLAADELAEFISIKWGETQKIEVTAEGGRVRHNGILHIQVVCKLGIGTGLIEARAEAIASVFNLKTVDTVISFYPSQVKTPKDSTMNQEKFDGSTSTASGYYMIPISCPFYVDDAA